ncbi:MAG: 2'-5' RNA ligase family protein [Pedobacter sp.]|nr:2'-5' RNA ligase family protein [Pedobacter sp.]
MEIETAPLILTLRLDEKSQAFFDELRKLYFPPERNYLDAHLTLFHHLPQDQAPSIITKIEHHEIELQVSGLRFLGAGVAYTIESGKLNAIRADIANKLKEYLIPQDRQVYRPHITIQNMVTPDAAKALYNNLKENFRQFSAKGLGLDLWYYLGGPWEHHSFHPFTPA